MIQRCERPQNSSFVRYGGRGIRVCERWLSFENFLADMGERPLGTSIDRIDNSKGYDPGNCRWATQAQQATNKRSNRYLVAFGERLTLGEWARRVGISQQKLAQRIKTGWSVERACSEPIAPSAAKAQDTSELLGGGKPIAFRGELHTKKEWARIAGIDPSTLRKRMRAGWDFADVIGRPQHWARTSEGQAQRRAG
jgi:hypothetical protein